MENTRVCDGDIWWGTFKGFLQNSEFWTSKEYGNVKKVETDDDDENEDENSLRVRDARDEFDYPDDDEACGIRRDCIWDWDQVTNFNDTFLSAEPFNTPDYSWYGTASYIVICPIGPEEE